MEEEVEFMDLQLVRRVLNWRDHFLRIFGF